MTNRVTLLAATVALLLLAPPASGAVFSSTPPLISNSSTTVWWFSAKSENSDGASPRVAYKLPNRSTWNRCVEPGAFSATNLADGKYTISIADDAPYWLGDGYFTPFSVNDACTGFEPPSTAVSSYSFFVDRTAPVVKKVTAKEQFRLITFKSEIEDLTGVKTVRWNFGDDSKETTSDGSPVEHKYARIGLYRVTAEVADNAGQFASHTFDLAVTNKGKRVFNLAACKAALARSKNARRAIYAALRQYFGRRNRGTRKKVGNARRQRATALKKARLACRQT